MKFNQHQDTEKSFIIKVILLFWFIRIFKPEWIVSYYIPALNFLKPIPTILLIIFFMYLVFTTKKIRYDKPLLFFLLVVTVSTFFSANRGISLGILRGISETFIIYCVMMTALSADVSIKRLFIIYMLAFAFFGIWGIIEGGKIRAFMPLDNEDSFGPFMCIGIPFAFYIQHIYENKLVKNLCFITFSICLVGAVVSFSRGAFLSLLVVLIILFIRSDNKIKSFTHAILFGIICSIILYVFIPNFYMKYENEMSTIWKQGTREQTAKDRIYLWTKAFNMFSDYPLVGIGPGCFGFRLPRYSDRLDVERWGVRYQTFGRHIHNIYIQIIAEMGLLGIIAFSAMLYYFWKRNLLARSSSKGDTKEKNVRDRQSNLLTGVGRVTYYYSLAVEGGMIAFLANAFFFNLLYFTWFWDLLILNSLLCQMMSEIES